MSFEYLEDVVGTVEIKDAPMPHQLQGLQYTASGYGKKIPTSKMAYFNRRWHRIYCAIYSNSGTCYVVSKGKHYVVRQA